MVFCAPNARASPPTPKAAIPVVKSKPKLPKIMMPAKTSIKALATLRNRFKMDTCSKRLCFRLLFSARINTTSITLSTSQAVASHATTSMPRVTAERSVTGTAICTIISGSMDAKITTAKGSKALEGMPKGLPRTLGYKKANTPHTIQSPPQSSDKPMTVKIINDTMSDILCPKSCLSPTKSNPKASASVVRFSVRFLGNLVSVSL